MSSIWSRARKYPDPPAPKLIAGYETIRRYGCFGCHEINGFAGADKRIGPDLRLEPNYYAAAEQLKTDPGLAKLDAAGAEMGRRRRTARRLVCPSSAVRFGGGRCRKSESRSDG